MNKILIITLTTFLISCNQGVVIDNGDWSGTINENSEESKIVRKLSKAYVDGNFEIAAEYMADDAVNTVNGIEYTKMNG